MVSKVQILQVEDTTPLDQEIPIISFQFSTNLIYVNKSTLAGTTFSAHPKKDMLSLLITLLIVLLIVGLIYWLVNYKIPLPPPIKTIINVVLVVLVVIWLVYELMGLRGVRL